MKDQENMGKFWSMMTFSGVLQTSAIPRQSKTLTKPGICFVLFLKCFEINSTLIVTKW